MSKKPKIVSPTERELRKYKQAWDLLAQTLRDPMSPIHEMIAASTIKLMTKAEELVGLPSWEERSSTKEVMK